MTPLAPPSPDPAHADSGAAIADLARRLRRVERVNRGLAVALGAALVAGAVGLRAPSAPPTEITARRIRMIDANDRVRAELGIDADGSAGLFVKDPEGVLRAAVVHDAAQTGLLVMDARGVVRLGAAQFAHGGGGFALHGEESRGAAVLYLKDRAGSMTFYDPDGGVIERAPRGAAAPKPPKPAPIPAPLPEKQP